MLGIAVIIAETGNKYSAKIVIKNRVKLQTPKQKKMELGLYRTGKRCYTKP